MGFKKILFGEKVPDKDDPKYKERYERDVTRSVMKGMWQQERVLPRLCILTKELHVFRALRPSIPSYSWHLFSLSCSSAWA